MGEPVRKTEKPQKVCFGCDAWAVRREGQDWPFVSICFHPKSPHFQESTKCGDSCAQWTAWGMFQGGHR